jgi:hypothetical protein
LNRFIEALAEVCREHLIREKWLIAPNLRVGHQWLESLTLHGIPLLNVRIKTFKGMSIDLAGLEMARQAVSLISDAGATIVVDRILTRLRSDPSSYFSSLPPSESLARTMSAAVKALRMAEVTPEKIDPGSFETPQKGRDVTAVLEEYLNVLHEKHLVDYPEVLSMATKLARTTPDSIDAHTLVLLPDDLDLDRAEKALVEALPGQNVRYLSVDMPANGGSNPAESSSDASLLQWILNPVQAPEASGDDSAEIFHAIGECNEVREVLRRIVSAGCTLDQVELLHTDREVYVSLVYETLMQVLQDPKFDDKSLPVTFAEGIPTIYSRTGRALTGWMEWMRGGFRQETVAKMIEDGLLAIPDTERKARFSRLATLLRSIPIGAGRDAYIPRLERLAAEASEQNAGKNELHVPGSSQGQRESSPNSEPGNDITLLLALIKALVTVSPKPGTEPSELLRAAQRFIEDVSRKADELDNYAAKSLLEQIGETAHLLEEDPAPLSLNVEEWLASLPGKVRVGGSGPRPGCLHVDHVLSGGHSGRKHTFIIGLDDGRFPAQA